jgi:flagellar motor protein MotB
MTLKVSPESDNKKVLNVVASAVCIFLPLIFFFIGVEGYRRKEFIEHRLNLLAPGEYFLLAFLLLIPFVALITGGPILIRKARRDDDTALFYAFCLVLMSFTPFSYCVLWAIYVYEGWATPYGQTMLSWAALGVIGLLVISVIYMTYLIMWSPMPASPFLKLSDIKDWKAFCEELQRIQDAPASRNGYPSLLERLPGEKRQLVLNALELLRKRDFHKDSMLPLVIAINELMTQPDFLNTKEFDGSRGLDGNDVNAILAGLHNSELDSSFNEVQVVHRSFLDQAYAGIIRPLNKTDSLSLTVRSGKHRLKGFQKNLQEGVIKSPFWATVFFFTIFLGITYLFCFAFAFHDRANLMAENKPALFSTRSPLYNVGDYRMAAGLPPENSKPSDNPDASSWPEYVFYFDSPHAEFKHGKNFNQEPFEQDFNKLVEHRRALERGKGTPGADGQTSSPGKRLSPGELKEINSKLSRMHEEWKLSMNSERLTRVVDAISLADDVTHGQGLQILVRGAADERQLTARERPGVSYPSNYTLSEARTQAVKYVLLERLANNGRLQGNFHWVTIPMSNEATSVPQSPQDTQSRQKKGNPSAEEELKLEWRRLDNIKTEYKDAILTQFERINQLSQGKLKDSKEGKSELLSKLKLAVDLNLEPDKPMEEQRRAQVAARKQVADSLAEAVDAIRYEHVDEDAGKRVVVVSIKPVQQIKGHSFSPLSLMDYMYFTIYTITTTGYGDIVPTTTYAKFLCSSANILEVFFFVVFFNGLLSMRPSREPAPRVNGAGGSAHVQTTGSGTPVASGTAGVNGESDLHQTLADVKALLQSLNSSKNRKWEWWPWGKG